MNYHRRLICKATLGIFFLFLFSSQSYLFAQDGQATFKTYCASCHKPDANFTGPALKGARQRQAAAGLPKDWVYKWVHNTTSMLNTDPYAMQLMAEYKAQMTAFPDLKNADIDAILDWADKYEKPAAVPGANTTGTPSGDDDNSLLYGLLTLILAVIALILYR